MPITIMEIIFALTEGIFPIFIFFSTVNNSFNSILLNLFTFFINVTNNNMAFPKIVSANASLYNLKDIVIVVSITSKIYFVKK